MMSLADLSAIGLDRALGKVSGSKLGHSMVLGLGLDLDYE